MDHAQDFANLVKEFCTAVEAGDGTRLAALFTEEGVYHDTFYGAFTGRAAIKGMLEERFYGDAERFLWEPRDMVSDGRRGYARWRFSYTSKMPDSVGKRVVFEGMSCFELEGGKISHYGERFDSGIALSQLDFSAERMGKIYLRWAAAQKEDPALRRHLDG